MCRCDELERRLGGGDGWRDVRFGEPFAEPRADDGRRRAVQGRQLDGDRHVPHASVREKVTVTLTLDHTAWSVETDADLPPQVRARVTALIDGFDREWSRFRPDSQVTALSAGGSIAAPADAAPMRSVRGGIVVDAGGDIAARGMPQRIAPEHPFDPARDGRVQWSPGNEAELFV